MSEQLRIGVLASGSGSNLQTIIDRCREGDLNAEITLVISNNPDAKALERAENANIPNLCINHRHYLSREDFDVAVVKALQSYNVQLVVLAGFMRIITETFISAFPNRVINIHPALLPAFPGLNVQQQAIDYGARFTGCTVHFVDGGVDTGPIIIQAVVPIMPDDTAEILSKRILQQEHQIYPRAIQLIAENRVHVEGRRVVIDLESPIHPQPLVNPPLEN